MDVSSIGLDFPFILVHILNILLYVAVAAAVGIFVVRHVKRKRSKA